MALWGRAFQQAEEAEQRPSGGNVNLNRGALAPCGDQTLGGKIPHRDPVDRSLQQPKPKRDACGLELPTI